MWKPVRSLFPDVVLVVWVLKIVALSLMCDAAVGEISRKVSPCRQNLLPVSTVKLSAVEPGFFIIFFNLAI